MPNDPLQYEVKVHEHNHGNSIYKYNLIVLTYINMGHLKDFIRNQYWPDLIYLHQKTNSFPIVQFNLIYF